MLPLVRRSDVLYVHAMYGGSGHNGAHQLGMELTMVRDRLDAGSVGAIAQAARFRSPVGVLGWSPAVAALKGPTPLPAVNDRCVNRGGKTRVCGSRNTKRRPESAGCRSFGAWRVRPAVDLVHPERAAVSVVPRGRGAPPGRRHPRRHPQARREGQRQLVPRHPGVRGSNRDTAVGVHFSHRAPALVGAWVRGRR